MKENMFISPKILEFSIKRGWFKLSEYCIKKFFNKNNVDIYPTFVNARKKLKLKYLENFEKLT